MLECSPTKCPQFFGFSHIIYRQGRKKEDISSKGSWKGYSRLFPLVIIRVYEFRWFNYSTWCYCIVAKRIEPNNNLSRTISNSEKQVTYDSKEEKTPYLLVKKFSFGIFLSKTNRFGHFPNYFCIVYYVILHEQISFVTASKLPGALVM